MNIVLTLLLWLFLNIMIGLTMDFALFTQTTPDMKNVGILAKILSSEFWASIEWMFLIPANRIGNTFLSAIQIVLASFIFNFIGQIGTNLYMLNHPIAIDDYVAMIIIFIGILISTFKIFG